MEGDGCAHRYPASLGSRHGRPISCQQSLIDAGTSDPAPRRVRPLENTLSGEHTPPLRHCRRHGSAPGPVTGHWSLVVGRRSSVVGRRSPEMSQFHSSPRQVSSANGTSWPSPRAGAGWTGSDSAGHRSPVICQLRGHTKPAADHTWTATGACRIRREMQVFIGIICSKITYLHIIETNRSFPLPLQGPMN